MIKKIAFLLLFGFISFLSFSNIFSTNGSGAKTNKHALIIGISNYSSKSGWAQISCYNDLPLIKSALVNSGFTANSINLLEDSLATKQGIIAALNTFAKNAKPGDIIFIHFSGHGIQMKDDNNEEKDKLDECLVPYDASSYKDSVLQNYIRDDELIILLNAIRLKIGNTGQLIFSSDASHSGPDETEEVQGSKIITGRGGIFEEFNTDKSDQSNLSPIILMAASLNNQMADETEDENGEPVGLFSYSFAKALTLKKYSEYENYYEFFDTIKAISYRMNKRVTPAISGSVYEKVFTPKTKPIDPLFSQTSKQKRIRSSCFVISIGINSYQSNNKNLLFKNSVTDAIKFSEFITRSFRAHAKDSEYLYNYLLLNSNAKERDILDTLNKIIMLSKPDDYFIFNFAGATFTFHDSLGTPITYFTPSDVKTIDDSLEIKSKGISLLKFKNLLDLIPANNQLIITEAGTTANFQKEFVKILIESSTAISSLTKRNRIIIVPGTLGFDNFSCNGTKIDGGPLNYFISTLREDLDFFNLFEPGYQLYIERQILKNEMDCNFLRSIYTQFFFERKFIEDLQYYLPENVMKTRGSKVVNEDKKQFNKAINGKYALILGTNLYEGKPQWNDLANPEIDAKAIAVELEKLYGFKTKLLLNPTQDSLYAALFYYSQTLDTNDQLIIFFAGHGDFDEKYFDDGFIVLNNSATTKSDPYRKTYIQHTELQRMINKLPPKQVLVVMDVCFGGTFDERVIKMAGRNKNDIYSDMDATAFVSSKLKYNTRIYITSGGKKEVPDGYKGKHSPFALRLLEALRTEGGKNGFLTATEIFAFVQTLPSGPQIGNFGDHEIGGEFMLVPKK